ncbi:MAG: alpha-L-fucosidase [Chitinophagaceae bacterium]
MKIRHAIFMAAGILLFAYRQPIRAQKNDKVIDENIIGFNWNKPDRIDWFNTLGMGMFVHFGVDAPLGIVISHSLVGASEDYLQRYFYQLPQYFNPYNYNPQEMARLAKLAGMQYVILTTKHHSGFCLWDTRTTDFNVMHTPYHKDMLKEYVEAVRAEGLGVGFYYSPEDFFFLYRHHQPINRFFDDWTPELRKQFDDFTRQQCEELMTNYGKIDLLFIDGEPKDVVKKTCWTLQPDLVITRGAMKTPEQTLPGQKTTPPWLSCITIGSSWQYQPTNNIYKTGNQLIRLAIDTRSKGGSLLMNVGPRPDGSIGGEEESRLRELAAWYFANHACMDSVQSWIVNHEADTWFTMSTDSSCVYAVITDIDGWNEGERKSRVFHSVMATKATQIEVLGQNGKEIEYKTMDVSPRWEDRPDGIAISVVRSQRLYDNHKWPNPVVVKLTNVVPRVRHVPIVETMAPVRTKAFTILRGKIYDAGTSHRPRIAYFQYREKKDHLESLYDNKWHALSNAKIGKDGIFTMRLPAALQNNPIEIKAVAIYEFLSIEGDSVSL